ncbi:MAG TPA: MoaD/ThiS family protein [Tepidiformaceae bacterium]|nr:MoaD/ThiS family protein [Tepidiformaceae bacterium]
MARVVLPDSLARLFGGAPRRLEVTAGSVDEALRELDARWPGMRDRLVDGRPAIRQHIILFVNGERATLDTPLAPNDELYVMPALSGG